MSERSYHGATSRSHERNVLMANSTHCYLRLYGVRRDKGLHKQRKMKPDAATTWVTLFD